MFSVCKMCPSTGIIGHEIWLRIFSEIVVFAHRKWWVVGGSESNACRLARSPRIGRERQIYPGAVRPSQRSAKYWLRAQNRSNKSMETTKSTSWWSKPASDTLEKNLKFVILITEKWFYHHFSSFFLDYSFKYKIASTLTADRFWCPYWY